MDLPNLPPSEHGFWDGEVNLRKTDTALKHDHSFSYDGDNRHVKCSCGVGYLIGGQEQLKDGHLYYKGELMF